MAPSSRRSEDPLHTEFARTLTTQCDDLERRITLAIVAIVARSKGLLETGVFGNALQIDVRSLSGWLTCYHPKTPSKTPSAL